jgi:aryl-alcohol dehydrogenase-like predicted oxidoreductase
MGVIPWSPLAGGWLSGGYGEGKANTSRRSERLPARYDLAIPENQKKLEVVNQFAKLAEESNLSLMHLALAFVLEHPAVTSAIIGPRTMEQLESQLDAADLRLERRSWIASTKSCHRAPTSTSAMPVGFHRR